MLEISSILMMSIVLLSLSIILIVLFLKHINIMYVFIEEMRKAQTSIHSDIVEIKISMARITLEGLKNIENQEKFVVNDTKDKKNSEIIKIPEIKANDLPDNRRSKEESQVKPYGDINNLKSSQMSESELSKLIGDKELMFKKQVSVIPGEMFINANIDIDNKK